MRLHHLSMTAFGPFPGTEFVDFDEVTAAGLFLVHGPTGAGKTTILDAVCFALFAATPGARPGGRSLRSDHAPRDTLPSVRLELTAAGRRLRVTRTPEFLRPKRRGSGETRSPASVTLEELRGGEWVVLSTRNDEVAEVVDDVLGMGLAQFARVVLLPQGEFAAFLRASVEERRQVLERLFDVTTYTDVEQWFADERRTAGAAVSAARSELATGLARLQDVLARVDDPDVALPELPGVADQGVPPPGADGLPTPDAVPGLVAEAVAALSDLLTTRMAELDRAHGAEREAARRLSGAEALARLRARGDDARGRLHELGSHAEGIASDRERVEAAERAAAVAGEVRAATRAGRDLAQAEASCRLTAGPLGGLATALDDVPGLESVLTLVKAGDDVLGDARRRRSAVAERADRRSETTAERDRLRVEQEGSGVDVDAARTRLESVRSEVEDSRTAGADAGALERRVSELETRSRARAEVDDLDARARTESDRHRGAVDGEQAARAVLLDLREARLADMAGELAEHLVAGDACPVCGSPEHPRAASRERAVTADDIARAETAHASALRSREAIATGLARTESTREARLADLGGDDRDAAALAADLAAARAALGEATARAAEAARSATRLTAAEEDLEQARERHAVLARRVESAATLLAALAEQDAADHRAVEDALAHHEEHCPCRDVDLGAERLRGTLSDVVAHHEQATQALAAHARAVRDRGSARIRAAEASAAESEALRAHGFDRAEDASAATLAPEGRRRLAERVRAHDLAGAQARATLEEPEVLAALDGEAPDLDAVRELADGTRAASLAATREHTLAETAHADAVAVGEALSAACHRLGPAARRQAAVVELADLLTGTSAANTYRMRLSSFVLAARLERVVELANGRLAVMGDGRFQLLHDDGLAARGARSGLGLRVRDLWTGQTRDTSTLSGGESFMASLALALALAEAVREEAGGFDLETLFIDEGFGTLDEESLEQVMAVLDDLRDGGRAVGVVSHVSDLRTRITSRVVVAKTPSGSSVTTTTAAAPGLTA